MLDDDEKKELIDTARSVAKSLEGLTRRMDTLFPFLRDMTGTTTTEPNQHSRDREQIFRFSESQRPSPAEEKEPLPEATGEAWLDRPVPSWVFPSRYEGRLMLTWRDLAIVESGFRTDNEQEVSPRQFLSLLASSSDPLLSEIGNALINYRMVHREES